MGRRPTCALLEATDPTVTSTFIPQTVSDDNDSSPFEVVETVLRNGDKPARHRRRVPKEVKNSVTLGDHSKVGTRSSGDHSKSKRGSGARGAQGKASRGKVKIGGSKKASKPRVDRRRSRRSGPGVSERFRSTVATSPWSYRRSVAAAWREEIRELDDEQLEFRMNSRLDSYMKCGSKVLVRKCGGCGDARCGSGTYIGTHTCKCKACPSCAWVRARGVGDGLERAYDLVETMPGYHWQMAVVSIGWNTHDEYSYSIEGLRGRAMAARRIGKKMWDKILKKRDAALLRTIEVSAGGFVHMNLIYYGPEMDKDRLEALGKNEADFGVRLHIKPLNVDPEADESKRVPVEDPRGSKKAVRKAAEYASKGHERMKGASAFEEEFLGGERTAEVVDPGLAARWEIATYRLHLMQRYGALRGMEIEEHPRDRSVDAKDDEVGCESCGVVGEWKWTYRNAEQWIRDCHDRGEAAMARSTWKPSDDWGGSEPPY